MKPAVVALAKVLRANSAPGTDAEQQAALNALHSELAASATSSGHPASLADAIFGYVANHHAFDLDSLEDTKQIAQVVFEFCCPLAKDDHRSEALLKHLSVEASRRASGL